MNVVMPQIAPPSIPANSIASPTAGANAAPGKFSTVLAQAQDANGSTTQQITSGSGNQKTPAKGDKSNNKPSGGNAASDSSKLPASVNNLASLSLPNVTNLATKPPIPQDATSEDGFDDQVDSITGTTSDSVTAKSFPSQLASTLPAILTGGANATNTDQTSKTFSDASGPAQSDKSEAKQADSSKSSNDTQQIVTNSMAQLGIVTPEDASSALKATSASVAAGQSPNATNNKQGTSVPKSSSAGVPAHGTNATGSKSPSPNEPSTLPQAHATSPAPSIAAKPDTSNGQTKPNATTSNKPADANKKDISGATEQTITAAKETLASHAATPTSGSGSQNATGVSSATSNSTSATPSVSPISTPVPTQPGNISPFAKVGSASAQAQSVVNVEDVEASAESPATAVSSALHAAKLVAGLEQSELRVGLHAGEFGSVDIRTSLARNQFTAEISVERGELGRVLAAELPALQHRFAEQQLPHPNITLQQHTSGESSDFRQGGRQQQGAPTNNFSGSVFEESFLPAIATESGEARGLDIHM